VRDASIREEREALVSERRASEVPTEPFELGPLVVFDPDLRVRREALPVGAQLGRNEGGPVVRIDADRAPGAASVPE